MTEETIQLPHWYRFVLSYPPHLVRDYLDDFGLNGSHTVLDPFCGTGTTLVESRLNGIRAVGLEANPLAHFASSVKLDWDVDPDELEERSREIAHLAVQKLTEQGIEDNQPFEEKTSDSVLRTLSPEAASLILTDSISPLPLHKTLVLLDSLNDHKDERYYQHARLALANALVYRISNLHFGPEVGVRNPKSDAPVVESWMNEIKKNG